MDAQRQVEPPFAPIRGEFFEDRPPLGPEGLDAVPPFGCKRSEEPTHPPLEVKPTVRMPEAKPLRRQAEARLLSLKGHLQRRLGGVPAATQIPGRVGWLPRH